VVVVVRVGWLVLMSDLPLVGKCLLSRNSKLQMYIIPRLVGDQTTEEEI